MEGVRRVHLAQKGFDIWKVVQPCVDMAADRLVLYQFSQERSLYQDITDRIVEELQNRLPTCDLVQEEVEADDLRSMDWLIGHLLRRIHDEQSLGNIVWVNIASGTNLFSAAAMVACMYLGARPYYCSGIYRLPTESYYDKGRMEGISSGASSAEVLPTFKLELPPGEEIRILELLEAAGGQMRPRDMAQQLFVEGIIEPSRVYRDLLAHLSDFPTQEQRRRLVDEGVAVHGPVVPGALGATRKKIEPLMSREPAPVAERGSTRSQRYLLTDEGRKRLAIFSGVVKWQSR